MKVRLDETLFKARAQENLSMTNDINKLEQVDALVECLDHFVADRKWVDEISRDELLTMVTQSNGDKEVLIESVLAKFNTPCIDTKKLKECKERRENKGLKESMKKRKSLKESDNRDTFTLDTSNTPILNCGLYYTLLGELYPGRYDERFKEFEECVKECAKPILDELVRQTPNFEVVSVGNYYHPRYYNYETDSLEFTVKYTGNDLGTVIEEYSNNQDFIDFLQNYKSYDGFISFFADNKDDFVKQDYVKSVSQIIKYNVTKEEYNEANENLYYDVMDCGFYPEDEDDTEESLKEKKYDIYVNDKYVASSDRHKRAKDVEDKIRKDGKIKYAGEKALRTAGVELDELNVGAKDKLKVKRARESKKLKEDWYEKSPLDCIEEKLQDADIDYTVEQAMGDRPYDTWITINDGQDSLADEIICSVVGYAYDWVRDKYGNREYCKVATDEDTISELNESKELKEGYYGQTLQDFLDDCMDSSAIDKIYIYGNDDVVYDGTIGGIPEDMRETEFLECDMYTNRKSIVTVNVDTNEEYGAGIYEFLNEFLDDCNCELVVIYDLAKGEEIFSGYKEDIPEEYLEYAFSSYDAPEEMSVNLNDYEGEDDFDESLDRYSKETKDFANKLCRLAKKDNRQLKFEDACEVIDQSFNNNADNIEDFYKSLNFDESLKESDEKEVEKLDTFDDQMDFLAKDEQEAIDGYKKVINKVRNAKVKSQLKKIETEEKAHKDYLNKVKKNKDLEYTEPLIERKGNKCCKGKCKKANESLAQDYYASVLKKFAGRTITEHDLDACAKELGINGYRLWNVLKELAYDKYITKGEKYGEEYFKIPANAYDELPSELKGNLNEYIEPYYDGTHAYDWFYKFLKDNDIKVKKATKFGDYDEYSGVAGGHTFKIYSFKPIGVINSRPEGFISSIEIDGVKIPQSVSSDRGCKELWDETFFSVKDVVELCNNNLDIDKIYLGCGCWKDEWKKLLEPLMIDFDENLKEADNLQTRATKMLSVKKYQIDLAWKNGKTWKTDPMTLDEISKSVGAKVTEKQFVDMMSDNIKGRKDAKNLTKAEIVKLYDYIDGKWKGKDVLWSIKGKANENLSGGCGRKKTSKRAK